MRSKFFASLLGTTVFFVSCAQNNSSDTEKVQEPTTVSVNDFKAAIDKGGVQILDVRTAAEFRSGYLQNALQADWTNKDEFNKRILSLDKNIPIYIYCQSGGRSASAQYYLLQQGYKVINMEGGMSNWKMNGLPVIGASVKAQMRVEDLSKVIASNEFTLVDVGAEWCPPCRKMKPVIDSLKQDKSLHFYFIAVDGGNDMDVMDHLKAIDLPTFIVYKKGVEVWRKNGIVAIEEFKKVLQ